MKKRISLVAMTLLMAVALTACGKTETVSVIDDDETENRTVVTTSVEEPEVSAPVEEQTAPESEVVETEPEVKPVVPPIEEFEYRHDDELDGMVITKYNGPIPMVIIPDEIDSEPVVAIGERAFDSKTSLESITMPDSITSIGAVAFAECYNLTNVKLPSSLETINEYAFGGCGFSEITLPDSLKSINDGAFNNCTNLKSITIPGNIKTINFETFKECVNLETVIVSEGITTISAGAFYKCDIKNITLPNTITEFNKKAFNNGNKEIVASYNGNSYTRDDFDTLTALIAENAASAAETLVTSETN